MGLGPVEASRQALARAGMTIDDVDLVEINEAFAAQVIPSYRDLGIPIEKLNVNGGAIAVGHPFGMTGARITGTLLNSLRLARQDASAWRRCASAAARAWPWSLERLSRSNDAFPVRRGHDRRSRRDRSLRSLPGSALVALVRATPGPDPDGFASRLAAPRILPPGRSATGGRARRPSSRAATVWCAVPVTCPRGLPASARPTLLA